MKQLNYGYLDGVLFKVTNLRYLSIAVDYISDNFLLADVSTPSHPLETLELDASGAADLRIAGMINPDLLFEAVAEGAFLENVRKIRVSKRLGWDTIRERAELEELNLFLEARANEDAAAKDAAAASGVASAPDPEAGVWIFE